MDLQELIRVVEISSEVIIDDCDSEHRKVIVDPDVEEETKVAAVEEILVNVIDVGTVAVDKDVMREEIQKEQELGKRKRKKRKQSSKQRTKAVARIR